MLHGGDVAPCEAGTSLLAIVITNESQERATAAPNSLAHQGSPYSPCPPAFGGCRYDPRLPHHQPAVRPRLLRQLPALSGCSIDDNFSPRVRMTLGLLRLEDVFTAHGY